mgnify:CR=1 FL=1
MSGSNKRRDKNATTVYSPEKNATGDILYPGIDAIRAWLESNAISEVECLTPLSGVRVGARHPQRRALCTYLAGGSQGYLCVVHLSGQSHRAWP